MSDFMYKCNVCGDEPTPPDDVSPVGFACGRDLTEEIVEKLELSVQPEAEWQIRCPGWVQRFEFTKLVHAEPCKWFLMCENEATGVRNHPVLGDVPICDRCQSLINHLEQ